MRTNLCSGAVLAAVLTLAFQRSGDAAPISWDQFDYPEGPIAGATGGGGFWEAFTGNGQVTKGSLIYNRPDAGELPAVGNHVETSTDGRGMMRSLNNQNRPAGMVDASGKFGVPGSTIYVAFLVREETGNIGHWGDYGGVSLFDIGAEEFFIGDPGFGAEHTFWGVDPQEFEGKLRESVAPVDTTVHLLVTRIDFDETRARVRFYVDPSLSAEPAKPSIPPFKMHAFHFDRVRLQGGGHGRYSFDDLFIGSTYADVTKHELAEAPKPAGERK